MNTTRRRVLHGAAGLAATLALPSVRAQAFPSSPLHIIIPTPAGGGHDAMMRLVGQKLTDAWGQPAIVESKAGAAGSLAAGFVGKAPADGLTMLLTYSAYLSNQVLQPNPGYKLSDFVPVCLLALTPIAIGVRTSLGVNTIQEWVALARKQPGKLTYGSYGLGSGGHFVGEQLNASARIDTIHVPYKGEAPAIQDAVGGQIDSVIASVGGVSRFPGKVKALAVASPTRFPAYPDVPTFAESGLPEVNLPGWGGVFVPAATPRPIVDKLAQELSRAIMLPDVKAKLLDLGFESVGWRGARFNSFLDEQMSRIKSLVDSGRVKL